MCWLGQSAARQAGEQAGRTRKGFGVLHATLCLIGRERKLNRKLMGRNGQGRQKAKAFDTYAEHCCVSSIETSRITSGRSPPCGTHSNAVTKVASSPWEKELGVEKIGTLINREERKANIYASCRSLRCARPDNHDRVTCARALERCASRGSRDMRQGPGRRISTTLQRTYYRYNADMLIDDIMQRGARVLTTQTAANSLSCATKASQSEETSYMR